MPRTCRVLCSAQHFGYGPTAELIALQRAMSRDERAAGVRLLLPDNAHLGALLKAVRADFEILPGRLLPAGENPPPPLASLLADPSVAEIDAVLSSFDSAAVFFGWFARRPVFFYDGLFWFWRFDPYRSAVSEHIARLTRLRDRRDAAGFAAAYHRLLDTDYHLTVLVAYHLATWAYARNGFGVTERLAAYPELATRTQVVGAVIDPTVAVSEPEERKHVLVSLSGSLAPLLTFAQNLAFARGALTFAQDAQATLGLLMPWYFSCHPELYAALEEEGRLADLPDGFHVTRSFDYRRNLEMIRHANALFISPGFSSIQEAAAFRTPVFFLPEQNGGQPAQLLMLRQAGYDSSASWTVTDVVCDGRATIGEDDVEALYRGVATAWSEALRPSRLAAVAKFRAVVTDPRHRSALVECQREAVRRVFGDFNGAEAIARHVLDVIRQGD